MFKELLQIWLFVLVVCFAFVTIAVALITPIQIQACDDRAEKQGVNVDYRFNSGCWVETQSGWKLSSELNGGE